MGFTPAQVNDMAAWEYECACDGWIAAHNPAKEDELPTLDDADIDRLLDPNRVNGWQLN